ncbi:MAG: efflux RND transporter periplasmic adaptor subunit [Candidatus Zixiibacteriota bacterium]
MIIRRLMRSLAPASAAAFMMLAPGGCGEGQSKPGSGARPGGGGTPVDAIILQPQPLENRITATGTLLANEEVELRSEISGRVTGIFFSEGSRVAKGTVLLKINDRELQAQLKRKEFEQALAADEERRQRALLDISGISREDYDKSLNRLNMIKAEQELIESQLAKTEIVAPFDGVVGLRYVSEGGYVSPNMLAATMQDIDPMKVEFTVPEKYALLLRRGTEVTVQTGESDESVSGTIYAVESKVDPGTRTIKARATIANPGQKLIPGSFARVGITLERIPDAIVVPSQAIIPDLSGEKVFVCVDGVAKAVRVQTGLRAEKSTQITNGLRPNDTLLVTGLLQLTEGMPVQINLSGEKPRPAL